MNPLSGLLSESWELYRTYARHLLIISFVVYLFAGILSALLEEVGSIFGLILALLITMVAVFLLQAALVKAVQDVRDGTVNLSVQQTFSAALPYIGSVAVASIIASILISFGILLLIIPGIFLITIWCLIVPVIVLEQSGALDSFGRSFQLVRQSFWNVFGTLFLALLILIGFKWVLDEIFSFMPHLLGNFLSSVIGGTFIAPFIAVVVTLMYFRLQAATAAGPYAAGGPYGGYGGQPGGPYGGPPQGGYGGPTGNPYATGFPPADAPQPPAPDTGYPPPS